MQTLHLLNLTISGIGRIRNDKIVQWLHHFKPKVIV
jgi:hypothetical protein